MYLLDIKSGEDISTYDFNNNEFDKLLNLIRETQARCDAYLDYEINFYRNDE